MSRKQGLQPKFVLKSKGMKRIITVCGLIAGLIASAWCAISVRTFPDSVSLATRTWLGYTSMVLSFSLIFVGIKQYRDNFNQGVISFGRAFRIGLLITLLASTVYVMLWLVSYYFFFPGFAQKYAHLMQLQLKENGAPAAEVAKQMADMAKYSGWYKNPVINILITYSEILPVGLVVSLIAAAILKKKVRY